MQAEPPLLHSCTFALQMQSLLAILRTTKLYMPAGFHSLPHHWLLGFHSLCICPLLAALDLSDPRSFQCHVLRLHCISYLLKQWKQLRNCVLLLPVQGLPCRCLQALRDCCLTVRDLCRPHLDASRLGLPYQSVAAPLLCHRSFGGSRQVSHHLGNEVEKGGLLLLLQIYCLSVQMTS